MALRSPPTREPGDERQQEVPARQHVERRHRLGQPHQVAARQQHGRPDLQSRAGARRPGQPDQRVGPGPRQDLGQPERVEAGPGDSLRQRHHGLGTEVLAARADPDADLHGASSNAAMARVTPASSTSWCVTKRTVPGAMAWASTPVTFQVRQELLRLGVGEGDDVRADRGRVEAAARASAAPRPPPAAPPARGPRAGGRPCRAAPAVPGAASTPAWRMPPPRRLRAIRASADHVLGPRQQRAHGRAEALGQAAHDGGGRDRPLGRGHPRCHLGVEQPGPVHVDGDRSGRVDQRTQAVHRPRRTRCRHVRVLDADERHRGLMVLGGLAGPPHVVDVDHAVPVVERDELDAGVQGGRAELVGHDVLAPSGHDGGTRRSVSTRTAIWFAMTPEGDEQRGRLAHPRREGLLQAPAPSDPRRSRRRRRPPPPWRGAWPAWAG